MLFDSHTHLTASKFDEDREETYQRAIDAGVTSMLTIGSGYGSDGNQAATDFAKTHDGVWAAVGVHPHEADDYDQAFAKKVRSLLQEPEVVCLGEIGLDYFYDHSDPEKQRLVFREMCELAIERELPISVHTRDAFEDSHTILSETAVGRKVGGVIHCFTGTPEQATAFLKLGFYISIPGIITYKTADNLRKSLKVIPTEKLLIETDAPFLAPVPYRGKRNEPAYVVATAAYIAELLKLTPDDVARITARNTRDMLGISHDNDARVAYTIRNSVYLNITNRCTLSCTFCPKFKDWMVKGHYLELPDEPDLDQVFAEMDEENWEQKDELVFCGYGEPTQRLDLLLQIAEKAKQIKPNIKVRLNTDGLGKLLHERDIIPELAGRVDALSVSMNADDGEKYARYCPNPYGPQAWEACTAFIRDAAASGHFDKVTASVVGMPNLSEESCRQLAESLGASFRYRPLDIVG